MGDDRLRADAALVRRGLSASRERARTLIESGLVTLNGTVLSKPAQKASETDVLAVTGAAHPYAGRGGLKLEKALRAFGVDPRGHVCMDIGASTGGFTDVLLQNGAAKVYAIDVGAGQLDARLAADPRVVNLEHTNARALRRDMFDPPPSLAVMDVSFISIRLILPAAFQVLGGGRMISLVKPQFEAGRAGVGKRGIVSDPAVHARVLREIVDFAPTLGWVVRALDYSPVAGGDGNIEFLADLVPRDRAEKSADPDGIDALVRQAHEAMKGVK